MKRLLPFLLCYIGSPVLSQTTMNIHLNNGAVIQLPLSEIDSVTYTSGGPSALPTLTTIPVGNVLNSSAMGGGNIALEGGTPVISRGVCWSLLPNPTIADPTTVDGNGSGIFSSAIASLQPGTTYYIRAYATNSTGTAYGNQVVLTTLPLSTNGNGVTDIDGNYYPSIILNTQEWMADNLRTTRYANGDPIPNVLTTWNALSSGAFCWYDDNNTYDAIYGKLYNGYAVSDSRNVCPANWHVPSDAEWQTLITWLDPNTDPNNPNNIISTIAGRDMKSTGTIEASTGFWHQPNSGADNDSGFNGMPGATRNSDNPGFSGSMGYYGNWWSATGQEIDPLNYLYWTYVLSYNNGTVQRQQWERESGRSIRCVKD